MKFSVIAAFIAAFTMSALAHEGHDHGAPPPPVSVSSAPRAQALSDSLELVAIARDGKLSIYVDDFATNEPASDLVIEVETPAGPATAKAIGDSYEIDAPWSEAPGSYELLFTIIGPQGADVLTASLVTPQVAAAPEHAHTGFSHVIEAASGALGIGVLGFLLGALAMGLRRRSAKSVALVALALGLAAQDPAPASARDLAQRLPDGSLFIPKPTQRLLGVRTLLTKPDSHARIVELPGRVIPDPDASGVVQASVSGRLSAPASGFPRLGARVKAGDVLAYVATPMSAAELSDQRQRQGELDQQIALVQQRIARYERLMSTGSVAKVQLDESRVELAGLNDRREALERRQAEALVAPTSGIIAASNAIAGKIAESNAIIFQIVEPTRLWVEALSFSALPDIAQADARMPDGRTIALAHKGSGLSDRSQSLPVHFAIAADEHNLRIGQLAIVFARTGEMTEGLAVPRASVVQGSNGQSIVYEHTAPERFEARQVRVSALDAQRLLIVSGLNAGGRVVTQGAELLNQVR
jgi:hypothetical protein